ncbi:MAG: UvrB/UvrC motif-containing protein [Saccharofermentans sp.]|nr:UvrB/UvrC motif-containing protein [Saccharofermentans sp.]
MRCSRCGAPIGNTYFKYNGALLCDNCARDLKIDEVLGRQNSLFEQLFPMPGEIASVLGTGGDLDFANTKIRCPRCGTSLRDIEAGGQLGCIECYNTFNESIMKNILKRQGSSEYLGRKPGQKADVKLAPAADTVIDEKTDKESSVTAAKDAAQAKKAKAEEKKEAQQKAEEPKQDTYKNLKDADLTVIPDHEIEEGMKQAAAAEDYDLAAKFRDELRRRKEDN